MSDSGDLRRYEAEGSCVVLCNISRCMYNNGGTCRAKQVQVTSMRTDDVFFDLYAVCDTMRVVDA